MTDFRDTHCHFQSEEQASLLVTSALEQNVTGILGCASSIPDAEMICRIAQQNPSVYFAAGVHPHEAREYDGNTECFSRFQESGKLKAIGEIGLDFYYDISDRSVQLKVFETMLSLALEMRLPASIHCRDKEDSAEAYDLAYGILKDFSSSGGQFVIHSYSGTVEYMERFAALGAWFGINGMITFRRAENIRDLVKRYPSGKILLETDSPYLAPVPHRGKENSPAFIPLIAEKTAEVRGVTAEEISVLTNQNTAELFSF
jgi:TatD DNase family protein